MVYEPQEDSYLLCECIDETFNNKTVLEIGCGSGIVSITAAKQGAKVTAVDIDKKALKHTKELAEKENLNIKLVHSDLFENIKDTYDIILCNPPYLPDDKNVKDIALDGGKEGWEYIAKFLEQAKEHVHEKGYILLLFSNLSDKDKVLSLCKLNELFAHKVKEKHTGMFETLYVYKLTKKEYLAKGKRGIIYTTYYNNKKAVIKQKNPTSDVDTIENEARFLKTLNKHNIGPKFILYENHTLLREHVDGQRIDEWLQAANKKDIQSILMQVLKKCYTMDKLGINKFEMTRPHKHILITSNNNKTIMIDFERCRFSEHPKNVTQFCQFLTRNNTTEILNTKGINYDKHEILDLATMYKKEGYSKDTLNKIIKAMESS